MTTIIIIGSIITVLALLTWRIVYKTTKEYKDEGKGYKKDKRSDYWRKIY